MLSDVMGKKINDIVTDYVVFDLETTGISHRKDEVVEISAVKVVGNKVVDEFTTLVNPGKPIPASVSAVHGIKDDMVAASPDFEKALGDFLEFVGDMVLVGHNIGTFDMKFINRDAKKYWGKYIGNNFVDTLPLSRKVLPNLAHYRLVDLAAYYGVSTDGAHRALNDCRMNQAVFEGLQIEAQKSPEEIGESKICPSCGMLMKQRNGKFGMFWGCLGYPNCKHTEKIVRQESVWKH